MTKAHTKKWCTFFSDFSLNIGFDMIFAWWLIKKTWIEEKPGKPGQMQPFLHLWNTEEILIKCFCLFIKVNGVQN